MKRTLLILVAALALALVAWRWLVPSWTPDGGRVDVTASDVAGQAAAREPASGPGSGAPGPGPERAATRQAVAEDGPPRWRITGQVVEPDGSAVGGADVSARVATTPVSGRTLATTVADREGRFALDLGDLGSLLAEERFPDSLGIRACAPGHLWGGERVELFGRTPPARPPEVLVTLERGAMVRGRVLDADGAPVDEAGVVLYLDRDGESTVVAGGAATDARGEYEVGFRSAGQHFLWILKEGVGCARLPPILLDLRDVRVPDTVLQGAGVLAGQVLSAAGTPIADLPLQVELIEAERPGDVPGLTSTRVATDAEGRFRLGGLRPGRYGVALDCFDQRQRLTEASTGDTRIAITIARPVLRVRVRDAGGLPAASVVALSGWKASTADAIQKTGAALDDGWLARGTAPVDWSLRHIFHLGSNATLALPVPSGSLWCACLDQLGYAPVTAFARAPATGEAALDLVLRRPPAAGRLGVEVATASGERPPPCRVHVTTTAPGGRAASAFLRGQSALAPFPVAPGRYRVGASPVPESSSFWIGDTAEVEVVAGQENTVRVTLAAGGRVRARFVGAEVAPDGSFALRCAVRSLPERRSVAYWHFAPERGTRPDAPALFEQLLRPGSYALTVEDDRWRGEEVVFAIAASQVSDVAVPLLRR